LGRALGALLVRYVTRQTRVCVKRYRRLLAAASRTITSRSCLHVLPARVEARAVANWRKSDRRSVFRQTRLTTALPRTR
jgi:hypothetical protein